jgi:uncharacterized integral membrane protein (TIGR00697 family)
MFIAALIISNLIFQKFFTWNPVGDFAFELSVGILPYPITFLITDVISEIFGKKTVNRTLLAGLFACVFMLVIVFIADGSLAKSWCPVSDETFHTVFGLLPLAVGTSMIAYLIA